MAQAKMDQLAKNAIANQATDDKVEFHPPRFNDTFLQWMEMSTTGYFVSPRSSPAWYNADGEIYVEQNKALVVMVGLRTKIVWILV